MVDIAYSAALISCKEYFRYNRTQAIWLIIVTVLISATFTVIGMSYWRFNNPLQVHVESALVSDVPSIGNRRKFLVVEVEADQSKTCMRQSQHLLYQDNPGAARTFVSIGSALNGFDLPESSTRYRLQLSIPSGLSGMWNYINRSVYACEPFGWVRGSFSTAPVQIDLGPSEP